MYPAADVAIEQIYLTIYLIHCIFYISENLSKNLKSKLCNQYDKFIYDFFICRNSISKELFYKKWSSLIEKYPSIKDYLMRAFYLSQQA